MNYFVHEKSGIDILDKRNVFGRQVTIFYTEMKTSVFVVDSPMPIIMPIHLTSIPMFATYRPAP